MQLKSIGKVSEYVKAFQNLDSGLDLASQAKAIGDMIDGIDNVSDLNTFFKQIGASADLATDSMKNSAKWADAIGDIAEGAGDGVEAVSNLSKATSGLSETTSSVSGLGLAFKGLGSSLLSIAPALAAIAGVTAVGVGIYMWATEFDRAVDKAKESQEAYASTASEVQSLNSEIETTSARIAELESAGPITLTEKSELEQLKLQNAELERQYELKQKVAEKQSDEAVEDVMDALSKQRTYDITQKSQQQQLLESDSIWDRLVAGQMASQGSANTVYTETDIVTATRNEVDALNELKDAREELILQRQNAKKDEKDAIDDQIDEIDNEIDRYDTEIQTNLEDLESLRQNFIDESTNTVKSNLSSDALDMYNQITDIIDAYTNTDKLKEQADALSEIWKDDSFAAAQQKLVDAFRSGQDVTIEDITNKYPDLVKACDEAGISVETLREELMALAQTDTGMTELEDQFAQFQSQAVSAINSMDSINAALANSFSGKGLGIEYDEEAEAYTGDLINIANAYKNLEGYDASVLFEKTANGVHLNREALRALQAQQESIQKQSFLEQQISLQEQYNNAVKELDGLEVGSDEYNAAQINIESLSSQLELVNQLSAAYDGATSAYQKWMDAQSNGEDGDMYRSVSETMRDRGKELYESGRYNTEEFRAIAQFYSNQDLSAASMEQVVKAYQNSVKAINRYFTGDKEGIDNLIYDIQKKVPDAIQEVEDESGEVKLKFNLDDESVADALGISQEALQTILRGASEYTDSIVLGSTSNIDDLEAKLSEMSQKAEEAKTKLEELKSSGDISTTIDFDVDTSKLDEAGLEDRINQLTNLKEEVTAKFGVDSSEVEYVNQLLEEAELRKKILAQQTSVSVSVDITGEGDIDALSQKLSSLPKDETSNVSINITDASQLDSVVNQIEQIPEDTPANISVTVQDDDAKNTLDAKLAEIESKNPTIKCTVKTIDNTGDSLNTSNEIKTVTVNEVLGTTVNVQDETKTVTVNYAKGTQESPEDKNAKVNYDKGKQENPEKKKAIVDYDRGKQEAPLSPRTAIVNYELGTVEKPGSVTVKVNYDTSGAPSGSGPANGTAHFYGTAFAQGTTSGDWSLKQNEPNALINELGSEIVVRDGKWFVLNNGYPTFANLRKGDVVFNHAQSESLLKNGYVTGSHARLAYESSYANGSAFSSGSWVFGNTGNGNLKGTGTKYTGSSTYDKATEKATKATEKAADTVSDAADKFEESFDGIEIKLDRMERSLQKLTDSIETYSYDLSKQSSVADQAMNTIRTDLTTLQQAYNRYMKEAENVDLSDSWKRIVQNGKIDVSTITDENLADQIKKYQEYFEKALDVEDTIADYQSQLLDLATQKLDNIEQYFENRTNYNDEFGYLTDISTLQDALNKLTAELDKQVLAGVIKEGSNEWYEAISKISEMQDALLEATLKKYQDIIDNLDRISTTLDNSLELKEARGETITEEDYQRPLEVANEQIDELYKKREQLLKQQAIYDVGSAKYDDYADQIADIDDEIYGLLGDIEDLKDKIWEVRWEPFFDGMEAAENLRNEMDEFRGTLSEDSLISETGGLTENGITSVALISAAMNNAKQQIKDYSTALEKLEQDLQAGNISTSEFEEKQLEFLQAIRDSSGEVSDYQNTLIDMYTTMLERENDVMQDSISKQKELLDWRKKNSDYAKSIRNQTKEINQIQAQINALSGSTNASSIAERKRLEAQLAELEDELQSSQEDRAYDVRQSGLDGLSDDLNEALDSTLNEITYNADKQEEVVSNMLQNVVGMYETAYNKINQIIANTGIVPSDDFQQVIDNIGTQQGAQSQVDASNTIAPNYNPSDFTNINTGAIQSGTNQANNDKIQSEIEKEPNTTNRPIAQITLKPTSLSLQEGKSSTIKATIRPTDAANKSVQWRSSNTKVATVSNGVVKAVKAGSAKITCAAQDGSGVSASCSITVTAKPKTSTGSSSGGDGIPKVGDRATLTGSYYYDSYGKKPAGSKYSGVKNGVVIDSYSAKKYGGSAKNPGSYDVHIKSADGKYGDLGWVKLSQLSGYAGGLKRADEEELAWTQEDGPEVIISPSTGAVLTKINPGDSVIPNNLTENLFKWGTINPDKVIPYSANAILPSNVDNRNVTIANHYDSLISIRDSSITQESLEDLKKFIREEAYAYLSKEFKKDARLMGITRTL